MIRKNIYLTEHLQRQIEVQSRRQQKPEAMVIRELLEKALKQEGFEAVIDDALEKLDQMAERHKNDPAPADLSARHDDYLYGRDND